MGNYRKNHRAARKATETLTEGDSERFDVYAQNRVPIEPAARSFRNHDRPSITTSANGSSRGGIEQLMDCLVGVVRRLSGRAESPSLGIIDSRSVGTSHHADPSCKGIDGNKKVKGRKQHIVVDSLGLPLAIDVHPANEHDSKGAMGVIAKMLGKQPKQ